MLRLISCFFVSAFCLITTPLSAKENVDPTTDPAGTWHWVQDYGQGAVENWLVLKVDGDKLMGNYASSENQHPITEGKVKDGKFSFKLELTNEDNGKPISVQCDGRVSGQELKATSAVTYKGETTTFDWKAARTAEPSDVVGTWALKLEAEGREFTPRLVVKLKDETLSAQYVTGEYGTFDAKEISLKKGKLLFTVQAESGQGKLDLKYEGLLSGNEIKGQLNYDVGSASGKAEFSGKRTKKANARNVNKVRPLKK